MAKAKMIMLATNDDNGCDTGRVRRIELGYDADIELEPVYWEDDLRGVCVCRIEGNKLKLSRYSYPILGSQTWVGNIGWNAVWVNWFEFKQIFRRLKESGKWQMVGGRDWYWKWWESTRI